MTQLAVLLILIPILTAIVIYLVPNEKINYLAIPSQLAITIIAIVYYQYFTPNYHETLFVFGGWDDRIGISLSNDALSMSFVFLAIFTWWMIIVYTFNTKQSNRIFLFFLLFLQGVFFGLIMTNDLFNMFVFLELATILITILIVFKKDSDSFRAGIYYLIVNTAGMLTFLIGVIILYFVFGTINILTISENMRDYSDSVAVRFAYVCLMSGVAVKAALFPVFTWLPKAHGVAQSAISALLSGLVVKAGLYLFIRINEMYTVDCYNCTPFFFTLGAFTAIGGVVFAMTQKDMKQILAYHTVSQVGIMMMGLSSTDSLIYYGGLLHIFNHAFFKSLLFLGAGIIIKVYRTKKVGEIRGVGKTMPWVTAMMLIGMLSITGAPIFNGFISKSILSVGFQSSPIRYWMLYIVNIGTAASFIKMSQIFFGQAPLSYPMARKRENFALMGFALMCILAGNLAIPVSRGFFGVDVSFVTIFQISKFVDYLATLAMGYTLYSLVLAKDRWVVRKIRNARLSFGSANALFVGLYAFMAIYFVFFA